MSSTCTCGIGDGLCEACSKPKTKRYQRDASGCACIQTKKKVVEQDASKLLNSTNRVVNYR